MKNGADTDENQRLAKSVLVKCQMIGKLRTQFRICGSMLNYNYFKEFKNVLVFYFNMEPRLRRLRYPCLAVRETLNL